MGHHDIVENEAGKGNTCIHQQGKLKRLRYLWKNMPNTKIQEAGCDMGTKHILWVKVNPDYEILFRLMDRLPPDAGRRYSIREHGAEVDIRDIREDLGQMGTKVKIAFPMSYSIFTRAKEYVQ